MKPRQAVRPEVPGVSARTTGALAGLPVPAMLAGQCCRPGGDCRCWRRGWPILRWWSSRGWGRGGGIWGTGDGRLDSDVEVVIVYVPEAISREPLSGNPLAELMRDISSTRSRRKRMGNSWCH